MPDYREREKRATRQGRGGNGQHTAPRFKNRPTEAARGEERQGAAGVQIHSEHLSPQTRPQIRQDETLHGDVYAAQLHAIEAKSIWGGI